MGLAAKACICRTAAKNNVVYAGGRLMAVRFGMVAKGSTVNFATAYAPTETSVEIPEHGGGIVFTDLCGGSRQRNRGVLIHANARIGEIMEGGNLEEDAV